MTDDGWDSDDELESESPDVARLAGALEDDDALIRYGAAEVLGKVFGYREVPPPEEMRRVALDALLSRWPREEDAGVRSTLAQTLALFRDQSVRPLLEAALTDPDSMVRGQAEWGLRDLDTPLDEIERRRAEWSARRRWESAEIPPEECVLVKTPVGSREEAAGLGRGIMLGRIAAEVRISSATQMMYWFVGEVKEMEEWELTVLTTVSRLPEVEDHIRKFHPYDSPDIMIIPIIGDNDYLTWITREVSRDSPWR